MSIRVDLLERNKEEDYEEFIQSIPSIMIYSNLKYREFLKTVLSDCEDMYFVASKHGRIVGCLPTFIRRNERFGPVINSLPFFGSHGGVLISPNAGDDEAVARELLGGLRALADYEHVVSMTVIDSPLDSKKEIYAKYLRANWQDERIGQLTSLPRNWSDEDQLCEKLMSLIHQKTRNSIRKALKSKVSIEHSGSLEALELLSQFHAENMTALGGKAKSWSVFKAIRDVFEYNRDYRIYIASFEEQEIAALLVFYYNDYAEYYTPATLPEFRPLQPMSLLIYEAMQEGAKRGCLYWNWGGTWLSQDGVHSFKAKWGARDFRYNYFVEGRDGVERLQSLSPESIVDEYPGFYVLPFAQLKGVSDSAD